MLSWSDGFLILGFPIRNESKKKCENALPLEEKEKATNRKANGEESESFGVNVPTI